MTKDVDLNDASTQAPPERYVHTFSDHLNYREMMTSKANIPVSESTEENKRNIIELNIIPEIDHRLNKTYPDGWEEVFKSAAPELETVANILSSEKMYYPLPKDLFRAFHLTPLQNVRVVIIGQDPYPQTLANGLPRAVGMSFSVRQNDSIPSSLKNIYRELTNSIKGLKMPNHGDLTEWAIKGVLLLNMCLTVRPGEVGSHGQIWMGFINKVLKAIVNKRPNTIFLLWGKEAQIIRQLIGERCTILESSHPSGLSANRGFMGCNHFVTVNKILISKGEPPINWAITPN